MTLPVHVPFYTPRRLACIYFICGRAGHVNYVGKSTNFDTHEHRLENAFVLPCPIEKLDELERKFIWLLEPRENVTYNPKRRRCANPFAGPVQNREKALVDLIGHYLIEKAKL